jgi:hypothetical protein
MSLQIMRFKSGNLRANMYVYKSIGDKAPNNAVGTHKHTNTQPTCTNLTCICFKPTYTNLTLNIY